MASVRTNCPECGDVELTTRDMQVRISAEDVSGTYSFRCPGCVITIVKPAEPRVIDLLLASGVEDASYDVPSEILESMVQRATASPITHDELIGFHEQIMANGELHQETWFQELVE